MSRYSYSTTPGCTVKDVAPADFIKAYASHLKKTGGIKVPAWANLVKTATYKELAPYDQDWYYIRAASVARKVYLRKNVGIGAFRKMYGGPKRNGTAPNTRVLGSAHICRNILQQFEANGIVEKNARGGRSITSKGRGELDRIALQLEKVRAFGRV